LEGTAEGIGIDDDPQQDNNGHAGQVTVLVHSDLLSLLIFFCVGFLTGILFFTCSFFKMETSLFTIQRYSFPAFAIHKSIPVFQLNK